MRSAPIAPTFAAKPTRTVEGIINHIALVIDASASMGTFANKVIEVVDNQIAYLAQRSKELDQETRVTVYTFDSTVRCLFYDKDVLRLPSLKGLYQIGGLTALIDATMLALNDLSKTATLYGDHAFLTYVITDGEENKSREFTRAQLINRLDGLADNWTMAIFVPNQAGVYASSVIGFPAGNISVWSTTAQGVEDVGRTMRTATDSYMTMRSTGVRGSRSLFIPDTSNLQSSVVNSGLLTRRGPGQFRMHTITRDVPIADFVEQLTGRPYRLGEAYYELVKPVQVQAQKEIALYEREKHTVYVGREARTLIGLPDCEVKVRPTTHPKYAIFVQSTSTNRKLLSGQRVLLLS